MEPQQIESLQFFRHKNKVLVGIFFVGGARGIWDIYTYTIIVIPQKKKTRFVVVEKKCSCEKKKDQGNGEHGPVTRERKTRGTGDIAIITAISIG